MIDVKHIAKLARLGLTGEEEKKFAKDLSSILDFVTKLKEADTKNVEPTAQVTGVFNIFRQDEINMEGQGEQARKQILENAPAKEKGYIKVKRVLE
ncbi:MAG: Asp-tRNA(Asn)/Glu-tRNA(Gln) amidotransferase subunit GatC [bacterium]